MLVEQLRDQECSSGTYQTAATLSSKEKKEHQCLLAGVIESNVPFSSGFTVFYHCCSADGYYAVFYTEYAFLCVWETVFIL